jgi:hypothetical protein
MPSTARVLEIASSIGTGNLARVALGNSLTQLSAAYASVAAYNPSGLPTTGLLPTGAYGTTDNVTAAGTDALDSIRIRAESDFAALPATDDLLPTDQAKQAAFDIASIETVTGQMANLGTAVGDLRQAAEETLQSIAPSLGTDIGLLLVVAGAILLFFYFRRKV